MGNDKHTGRSDRFGYVIAGLLGAVAGGLLVACVTPAIPEMMKRMMVGMMGMLASVPPAQAEKVARLAHEAGIDRIWLKKGADSPDAIQYCQQKGMSVVHNHCILMFATPLAFMHKPHRWVLQLLGQLPK